MWDACAMLDTVDLLVTSKSALRDVILLRDMVTRLEEIAQDVEFVIMDLEFATALQDSLVPDASTKLP